MLDYRRSVYTQRVNTFLGSAFLVVWAGGCGLLIWHAAFGQNPLADAFAAAEARDINSGN